MNTQTTTTKPNLAVVDSKSAPLCEILDRDGGVIVHDMLTPEVVHHPRVDARDAR